MADEQSIAAAEFFRTMIRIIADQHKAVTSTMIATSALIQAMIEKHPEIAESYERYRAEAEKSSPLALKSAEIVAELERVARQATAESDPSRKGVCDPTS
jgi:hypothetical protein